ESLLLLLANSSVFGHPLLAGTQHDQLLTLANRFNPDDGLHLARIQRRELTGNGLKALRLLELVQPVFSLRLPRGDHVVVLALADLGEIFGVGYASIDDHRGSLGHADSIFEKIEHAAQCFAVLGIAFDDLMSDRKPFPTNHQSHHDLYAIGA